MQKNLLTGDYKYANIEGGHLVASQINIGDPLHTNINKAEIYQALRATRQLAILREDTDVAGF